MSFFRSSTTFFSAALASLALGQCPTGDVNINSQEEVDAYAIAYGSCDTLPGSLNISGFMAIDFITDLSAFSNLKMIEGDLIFSNTYPTPTNFVGFGQLQHIGGDFIAEFGRFKNFDGLQQLQRVDGDMIIQDQDSLENYWGLNSLQRVGGDFGTGAIVNDIFVPTGLNALDSVYGSLSIGVNPNATSYTIPNQLHYVGGNFGIGSNATSMSGGNNLEHIGGMLILNGTSFTNLTGYNALKRVGSIQMNNNPVLTTISGFAVLDTIMDDLWIQNNSSLANLSGFPQLDVIADQFWVMNNPNLTTISGFADLDSIGKFWFEQNPVLSDLQAFDQSIALGSFQLNGNPQLSLCAVQAICERFTITLFPIPNIFSNAAGCMSNGEVIEQCELTTGLAEERVSAFTVYPNPVSDVLFYDRETGSVVVRVFDMQHRQVLGATLERGQLDVSALKPGHYFLEIGSKEQVFRTSFIKM